MCPGARGRSVAAMGFLDRAMKAATVAREQIEEVREVHALARHRPELPAEPGEHEQRVVERAVALGAPPPTLLLTAEEASEVVGVPLGGPHLVYGDDTIGVRFSATGPRQQRWGVEIQVFHAPDEDTRFDAEEHWHGFVAEHVAGDGGAPVDDLGEAALASDGGTVYVLAPPLLFFTTVTGTPGDPALTTTQATHTARAVLRRLGA